MQQCCTSSFFLIGNTKRKKHGETRAARTYVAQLDGYGVFPPFFVFFFGPLHPLSKHRTPTWWLIFFFNSVFLIWILVNQVAHKILGNNFLCAYLVRFSGWAIHPGYPWSESAVCCDQFLGNLGMQILLRSMLWVLPFLYPFPIDLDYISRRT